jgi:hypothetical protein
MAFGPATVSDIGGGVSDLFSAQGDLAKQQNDYLEGQEYGLAGNLASQNSAYTEQSTAIKLAQQNRELLLNLGGQKADTAAGGFAASGSSLDLLRDSAAQGSIVQQTLAKQGQITEAGYQEQAQSYSLMQEAANNAGNAEGNAAKGAEITGGLKIAAGVASLFTGGESSAIVSAATAIGGLLQNSTGDAFQDAVQDAFAD